MHSVTPLSHSSRDFAKVLYILHMSLVLPAPLELCQIDGQLRQAWASRCVSLACINCLILWNHSLYVRTISHISKWCLASFLLVDRFLRLLHFLLNEMGLCKSVLLTGCTSEDITLLIVFCISWKKESQSLVLELTSWPYSLSLALSRSICVLVNSTLFKKIFWVVYHLRSLNTDSYWTFSDVRSWSHLRHEISCSSDQSDCLRPPLGWSGTFYNYLYSMFLHDYCEVQDASNTCTFKHYGPHKVN